MDANWDTLTGVYLGIQWLKEAVGKIASMGRTWKSYLELLNELLANSGTLQEFKT